MAIYEVDTPVKPTEFDQADPTRLSNSPGLYDDEEEADGEANPAQPLVDYVIDRFSEYQKARDPLEKKWDAYYRMWRCLPDPQDQTEGRQSERSQIKIPATKEAVTNATDSLYQVIFPPDWFDIQPMPTDLYGLDPMQAAQLVADKTHKAALLKLYLNYLFSRELLPNKLYRFIQDTCIYGTGLLRVKVATRTNKQVQRTMTPAYEPDPMTGEPIQVGETEEVRTVEQKINHPETVYVPIESFYTNINATGTQAADGCEACIVRSYAKDFQVKTQFPSVKLKNMQPAQADEVRAGRMSKQGLAYQPASNDVELLEFWGFVPNEVLEKAQLPTDPNQLGTEMAITVANQSVLCQFELNPFAAKERPFIKFCFEEVNNEFYGLGIAEVADGPQRALNAMFRSRLDNMALSLNNIFGINFDKMVPGQNLSMHPGKAFLFHGDPREALFPIVVPDVTANIYRDAEAMRQTIQSAHGVSPMLGGQAAKGGEQTATEVSMLMGQSTSKIKTIAGRFERSVVCPLLQWYTRLTLQYLNEEEVFAILDPASGQLAFQTIKLDDVIQDYEFVPRGVMKMMAANESAKYAQALQLSANPVDAQFVNRPYLWQKFYQSLGLNDLEAAVLTTPAMVQMQAQAQAQSQAQAQLPAPGQPASNPTVTGAPVQAGPSTNSADQPGGLLSIPSSVGGMPNG